MTAAFQARLGCDACTHWLKEIDATLAVDMRHAAPLSSQREAWPHRDAATQLKDRQTSYPKANTDYTP